MIRFAWGGAATAVCLLMTAAPEPAAAAEPTFRPTGCTGDYAGVTHRVECGVLTVDEARERRTSRRIQLPVAIVRAKAPKPGLPPVVFLHGGPGGSVVANVPGLLKGPNAVKMMAVDQDWIFFDQRGAGLGSPSMNCPGAALTDVGPPTDRDAAAITACLQRFRRQGVDLARYNVVEIARDVQDLRRVLKLDRIDIYSRSYGPRIAAAMQRHAPQGIRAVVQDSPWPPEAKWTVGTPQTVAEAIRIVLRKCAAQAECARRYPDLQARFEHTARAWLARPHRSGGRTYTSDDLAGYMMEASYTLDGVRRLPSNLNRIVAGDMTPLDEFKAAREFYYEGQHLAHLCREEIPFENRRDIAAGAAGDPLAQLVVRPLSRLHDICGRLRVAPAPASEQEPVSSPIPNLFLAAEIDPGCPPHWAVSSAKRYGGAQVVVVTNATHGVAYVNACASDMVRAFYADPTRPVDRSCLPAEGAPFPFLYEEAGRV